MLAVIMMAREGVINDGNKAGRYHDDGYYSGDGDGEDSIKKE